MPRNVHIFVGDRVKTVHGEGIVDDVNTWRDRVVEMTEPEAKEFCDQCYRNEGVDYRETWAEVFVIIGGRVRRYLASEVEVLESRDAPTE